MGAYHKIAEALISRHAEVVGRGVDRLPLQRGDRVADAAYVGLPVKLPEGFGNVQKTAGRVITVEWDDGTISTAPETSLVRVAREYIPSPHDSAYEIPVFRADDPVILGNGSRGKVLAEVVGPTGFRSFRVQVTDSVNRQEIGRRIFATPDGMIKAGSILPDVVVSIIDPRRGQIAMVGCELATTTHQQSVGLQKYSSLPRDAGMLFPYNPPSKVTFHMGSVGFPIDIMFVDGDGQISRIWPNCEPGSAGIWGSNSRVAAVLEVNGGWCQAHTIYPGHAVMISIPKVAQESYIPGRTDVHNYQSPGTARPAPSERYRDRQTPDEILQDVQPLDGEHYELQIGYDPSVDFGDDAPRTRPH